MSRTFTRAAAPIAGLCLVAGPLAGSAAAAPKPKVPTPVITAKPAAATKATSATFEFTHSSSMVTFQCQLDLAAWVACTSPKTYAGPVADGAHSFKVRARDASGSLSQAATATWTVDTAPPSAPALSGTPASPTGATGVSIGFTSSPGATFACALDGAAEAACTSPFTASSLADGAHTFTVTARDAVGNASAPTSHAWTVDTSPPPAPTITTGPANLTNATSATFGLHDADPSATLACSLDGATYAPCGTSVTFSPLAEGAHTLDVRAADELGNTASAPRFSWTVDLTAPAPPTILTGPSAVTKDRVSAFTFDGHDAVLLECSVDGGAYGTCLAAYETPSLADGAHTLHVRGTDSATNVSGSTPYAWTVDGTPPPAPGVTGPAALTQATTATFTIGSTEEFVTFTCALDGAVASPCASGVTYESLGNGAHTLVVTSSDSVGNAAQTTFSWTVDTLAPLATVTTPAGLVSPAVVTFSEPVANVRPETFGMRVAGTTTSLPGTITCRDAASAVVSCLNGPVKTASLLLGVRLVPGQHYTVQVSPSGTAPITDLAGNALATSSTAFRGLTTVQEISPAAQYGWRGVNTTAAHGGTYVAEHLASAAVAYSFTGESITWYTITGPDQGKADVFVDGVLKGTVNNYAAKTTYRVPRSINGLAGGRHQLRIVAKGQKGSTAGTNSMVSVDAMKVGTTLVANPPLTYVWKTLGAPAASGGFFTVADLAQETTQMQFRGTSVTWYTVTGRNQGKAQVWIDGVLKGTIDNYSATTTYNVKRTFGGLPDKLHVVRIVILGQHRAGGTGNAICLDKWVVV